MKKQAEIQNNYNADLEKLKKDLKQNKINKEK
jgi:hypothetical protein